ncbi:MAG: ribonuclease R [Chlamydiales bacterium]|nr:ribonuclease R [Chlamydiales bacterium]
MKRKTKKQDPKVSLIKKLLKLLKKKSYEPLTLDELKITLNISQAKLNHFDLAVKELIISGQIEVIKKRFQLPRESKKTKDYPVVKGELFTNPKGFAFLHPSKDYDQTNIFIPKSQVNGAINGDIVEVQVTKTSSSKGPEGRVIEVLEREIKELVVTITEALAHGRYLAFSGTLGPSHPVLVKSEHKLKVGDRILGKVFRWHKGSDPTILHSKEKLGHISKAEVDTACSCIEHNIRTSFPKNLLKEVKALPSRVSAQDLKHRLDLRDEVTLTIDPDTAKDFDDAISIKKDNQGSYHLGVHIADVSHYVKEGSAIDKEAALRGNSTYFPDSCIPMLPFELSNELCSLKPRVNRLCISVFMHINKKGELENYQILRSVIKSNKRFTYKEALQVLEKEKTSPYLKELKLMTELCHLLKQKRKERGSIEFALPEAKLYVDDHGIPSRVEMIEYDITHQMIEEFMLKANEVIAKHLSDLEMPLPFRVHEEPKTDSLQDFSSIASLFGYQLSHEPTSEELQEMFDELSKTPETARLLSILFIRSMKLATYSTENVGHYGLSLEHYCHFTSPIRRYSDLIVHRLLFSQDPDPDVDYAQLAESCSIHERQSAKAEMQVNRLKKLRLLEKLQQKHPYASYKASITSVKAQGISFETDELLLEGFIHISQIDQDYLEYSKETQSLTATHSKNRYTMGQKIEVMLLEVDLIRSESRWCICPAETDGPPLKKRDLKKSRKPAKGKKPFLGSKKTKRGKKRKKR